MRRRLLVVMFLAASACGRGGGAAWDVALGAGGGDVEVARGGDALAVLVGGQHLLVHDVATGARVWERDLGAHTSTPAWVAAQAGWLCGRSDGRFALLDGATGAERWAMETKAAWPGSALVDGATAYVGGGSSLFALDLERRAVRWQTPLSERWSVGAPPVKADGRVYLEVGEDIVAVDAASGAVAWRHATSTYAGREWTEPVAVADGKVLAGTTTKAFIALGAADGAPRWSATPGSRTFGDAVHAAALVAGDRVCWGFLAVLTLIESREGPSSEDALRLSCAKIADGSIVWTADLALSRGRDRVGRAPELVDGRLWAVVGGALVGRDVADGSSTTRPLPTGPENAEAATLVGADEGAAYVVITGASGARLHRVPVR